MTTPVAVISVEPKSHLDKKASDAALLSASAPATKTTAGVVKQAAFVAPLVAAPTMADFNGLVAKLIAAGLMASA